jgi:hypothetical protein
MLGTDIAVEAADYVLMRSDLEDVLTALDLSKKTFRRIYYNYGWAFIYNLLMVPLAAGVLYPPLHFQLPPWVRTFLFYPLHYHYYYYLLHGGQIQSQRPQGIHAGCLQPQLRGLQ